MSRSEGKPTRAGGPTYRPAPGSLPPPGETLLEWLEENSHTQVWLAGRMGMSPKQINRIIRGHSAYPADVALRLAEVTDVPARFWMHLQADYQLNHAELHTPATLHMVNRDDRVGITRGTS